MACLVQMASYDETKQNNQLGKESKTDNHNPDHILKEIRQYFHELDVDGSGKLGPNEFSQMLEKIGVRLEQQELMRIYRKADENGDGEVSFREFLSAFAGEKKENRGNRPLVSPKKSQEESKETKIEKN